jgi:hypothetical protein
MIGQRQTPLGSIPGGWSELNLAKFDNPDSDSTSANGTQLPRTCATARPQLAKADTAFQAHPLVNRLNLA